MQQSWSIILHYIHLQHCVLEVPNANTLPSEASFRPQSGLYWKSLFIFIVLITHLIISSVQLLKELTGLQRLIFTQELHHRQRIYSTVPQRKVRHWRGPDISSAPTVGLQSMYIISGPQTPTSVQVRHCYTRSPGFVSGGVGVVSWSHRQFLAIQLALTLETHLPDSCRLYPNQCKS